MKYTPITDHIYSFPEYYLEKIYHSIQMREDGSVSGNMNILAELVDDERYSYKNDAYREEKEWRLIFISNGSCEFRECNGLIIPYNPLHIPLEAVESITLGPCTDKKLAKESLSSMLFHKTQGLASEKI